VLTWVKNVGITPFSWMYSTELILFGRLGNLPLLQKGLRLDFSAKVREHSRKPDEFYERVKLVSPEPRLDLFSREKRDGFEQWGIETDYFAVAAAAGGEDDTSTSVVVN
jgi:N6-adenosine-specific RNA methylase IME4